MGNDKLIKNGGKGTNVGNALRFLAKQGKVIAPSLLDLASSITGIQDLKNISSQIRGTDTLTEADKDLLLKEVEYDMIEMQEVTKRWISDNMTDNYMSKNIRPLTLGFLTATLFIYIILDSSIEAFDVDAEWVSLLKGLMMLAYGGYFGARTAEKIFKK
jgi:glycogen synthase